MDWQGWQDTFASEFRAGPGQPVFLYVDDDLLSDLAGEGAAEDLGDAVRTALGTTGDVYRPILRRATDTWCRTDENPPPTLPLLALTVLAATRMERRGRSTSNAYYKWLWEAAGVSPKDPLAAKMRREFDTVATLWRQFDGWLKEGGSDYGVSTIRLVDQQRTLIGYPLSQALLRKTDRNVLTRLWAALGRDVATTLSGDELVSYLRRWMRSDRGLSRQFIDTVERLDERTLPEFAEVLHEAARRWDGIVRSKSGSRLHEAVLAVQHESAGGWKLVWIVGAPSARTTVDLKSSDLMSRHVVYSAGGEEWTGVGDGVVVLRWDDFQGCWLAADRMLPGVPHAMVWHPEKTEAVKKFVTRSVSAGTLRPQKVTSGGVSFIEDIRFNTDSEIRDALTFSGLTGIQLAGSTAPRLALSDGLRVSNQLYKSVYIRGGEPDLAIPPGEDRGLSISIDRSEPTTFSRGVVVPLRIMSGGIPAGHHTLESAEGTLEFETVDPGHLLAIGSRNADVAESAVNDSLAAEVIDTFGPRLVLAKRNRDQTWLVGPAGHIREVREPTRPSYWLRLLGHQATALHFLCLRLSHEGWLVQRKGDQFSVDEIVAVPPDVMPDKKSHTNDVLWRRILELSARNCSAEGWQKLLAYAGIQT